MSFYYLFVVFTHFAVNSILEVFAISEVKGSTVQLVCPFKRKSSDSLAWSFKSATESIFKTYTINDRISPYLLSELLQRLSVTGNHSIGEYHLTISDIRESDQGMYQCIDTSTAQSNTQDFTVIVKAVITSFSPDILNTEETRSFDVSCQSTGSRPAATMYWLLGQQTTNITSNSSTQSIHNSSADVYAVTSNLKYRVDKRYNGKKLICRASNVAGYMETSLTLNVKYAPGVTVENKTFSQTQTTRQIQCTLNSNPQVNTCKWHQQSKYGEHIRDFSDNNLTLTLPTVPEYVRYQDTGEYICTAENSIIGMNGQLKQTGSGYVISNAQPVITADNKDYSTQYGMFGKSTKVYVNIYSIPKYFRSSWYIHNTQLVSNKYATNEEPAIVKDGFHGVDVQLDGYRVSLTISNLQEADFTNYTLRLYYSSQYVQHEVTLESSSAPETPSNFTITSSSESSITVQWIPGYDGGQTQTFYIEYRINGSSKWLPQEVKNSNQIYSRMVYNSRMVYTYYKMKHHTS